VPKPIPIAVEDASPAPRAGKVRASHMGKWRAAVLIGVHVLIALHIAHWLTAGETITPVEPSEAMAFSRDSVVNAGLVFFALAIASTAIFGRYFCGWACHLVALQDFCRYLMMKMGITPRPLRTRTLVWVPTLAFAYMFLWPLAYRLWTGDSLAVRGTEFVTAHFWATFPGWVIGALTFLICGFATVYFLGAKGFCTHACPYGAIFAAADRLAPLRIRVTDACNQCGHCSAVCSSNVTVHQEVRDYGMVVSPGCMKCHDCVSVCPTNALYYGVGTIPLLAKLRVAEPAKPRTALPWRDETLLVLAFAASFFIVRGLYGVVPFLMSLGVAGVVAFLVLTFKRLLTDANVERPGLRLKRMGKLLPAGKAFLALMLALLAFLAHSAYMQPHTWITTSLYERSTALRAGLFVAPGVRGQVDEATLVEVRAALSAGQALERAGLFTTLGNAARMAWFNAIAGEMPQAQHWANLAIAREELPEQMTLLLGHAIAASGDLPGAHTAWRHALAQRPGNVEVALVLGLSLAKSGSFAAAQQVFDDALVHAPESATLAYNAGLARAVAGKTEDSVTLFRRAVALNPHYIEARENLAGVLASLGRFAEAVAEFSIAVDQNPKDPQTRVLLARALLGQGDQARAIVELQNALALDAQHTEARALLQLLETPQQSN
jgi:polyferredoxin/Flp pilus assembly protein TadD